METSRRRFLLTSGAAAAAFAIGAREQLRHPSSPAVPRFRLPLAVPPVLQPVRVEGVNDYCEIDQRETRVEILPGKRTTIWGYQGIMPGPTIRVRRLHRCHVHGRKQVHGRGEHLSERGKYRNLLGNRHEQLHRCR